MTNIQKMSKYPLLIQEKIDHYYNYTIWKALNNEFKERITGIDLYNKKCSIDDAKYLLWDNHPSLYIQLWQNPQLHLPDYSGLIFRFNYKYSAIAYKPPKSFTSSGCMCKYKLCGNTTRCFYDYFDIPRE